MSFTPFETKKRTPRPPADPLREAQEEDAGEVAAHAIIQTIRGPLDLQRFYREQGSPREFAERIFPPTLFTNAARDAFLWFFLSLERAKKGRGEWTMQ